MNGIFQIWLNIPSIMYRTDSQVTHPSSIRQDFLRRLQRSYQHISENSQHADIRKSGLDSSFGVVEGMLLDAKPPSSS